MLLACSKEMCFHFPWSSDMTALACDTNLTSFSQQNVPACLSGNGAFAYGIYKGALPVISSNSLAVKILYPIFWGLMTLSIFGNDLEPTSNWLEVIFSIINVLSGLMLFTLLIGNIQWCIFAAGILARRAGEEAEDAAAVPGHGVVDEAAAAAVPAAAAGPQVRARAVGGHHRRRGDGDDQGPAGGPPAGHQAVPLPGAGEAGAPVPRHGRVDPGQHLRPAAPPGVLRRREGDPGGRPGAAHGVHPAGEAAEHAAADQGRGGGVRVGREEHPERRAAVVVPAAAVHGPAAGVVRHVRVLEAAHAFCLDAPDLRYITEHFRYKFANDKLKRTARYYSSNWRTWAAVNVQLAWRRYRARVMATAVLPPPPAGAAGPEDGDRRLRHYAAMFMSLRPHDHLE
ncbi:hypothetical protein VPH35_027269 [Triticum aestivum]